MSNSHDLKRQLSLVREALRSEKRRLGFFVGAGCPLGIFDKDGKNSVGHIPDVAGLTSAISDELKKNSKDHFENWEKLTVACSNPLDKSILPNVEHILTQLRILRSLKGMNEVDGMTPDSLGTLDLAICKIIARLVGVTLPDYKTSYHRLAAWIGHLDRTHPVEIFTPNYDLLLEEALEVYKVPFFDGFVGARQPFFDLTAIEDDQIPNRWLRLWKIHGSINWFSRANGEVFRSAAPSGDHDVMIYPSHLKYDQSRRMPYLAMCDQVKRFFRTANPVIFICGYSFADEHLNELIFDGLRTNKSAHCFSLLYSGLEKHPLIVEKAKVLPNLTILAWDGGVIGTRSGLYEPVGAGGGFGDGFISTPKKEEAGEGITNCNLGDFHHFCLFIEKQFGVTESTIETN